MSSIVPRVVRVDVVGPRKLDVGFVDGSAQRVDLEPALVGDFLSALRDPDLFKAVSIDAHGSLTWPTGVTLSPWILHDWPNAGARWVAQVQRLARNRRRLRVLLPWLFVAQLAAGAGLFSANFATFALVAMAWSWPTRLARGPRP